MQRRFTAAMAAILFFASAALAADATLVAQLQQLGDAVDNMSKNISTAGSDADAQMLAKVTQQALDQGLKQDKPTIEIKAGRKYCLVTIKTAQWKLWSEARDGKIVDHGAKVH